MKLIWSITFLLFLTCFVVGNALGQEFFIYPNQGQSNDQMEQDKFQCYNWAKGQTGFDPMQVPKATSAPPPKSNANVAGGAVKGGLGGALLGAGIGAIAGDTKKGAANLLAGGAQRATCNTNTNLHMHSHTRSYRDNGNSPSLLGISDHSWANYQCYVGENSMCD